MPRTKPKDLTINLKTDPSQPIEPAPNSSPITFEGIDLSSMDGGFGGQEGGYTSLPPLPASPNSSPGHSRNQSGNLLNNYQSNKSKSTSRTHTPQDEQRGMEIRRVPRERGDQEDEGMPTSSSMSKIYHLRQNGSTPQLSFLGSKEDVGRAGSVDGKSAFLLNCCGLLRHQSFGPGLVLCVRHIIRTSRTWGARSAFFCSGISQWT